PGDIGTACQRLIGLPGDIVGGIADAKDGVQQQVELASTGTHDQIRSRNGSAETRFRFLTNMLHAEDDESTHHDRQYCEYCGGLSVQQALEGDFKQHRCAPSGSVTEDRPMLKNAPPASDHDSRIPVSACPLRRTRAAG